MKAGLLWAGAILCAVPLLAHHSAAAEYDLSRTVRISGAIAKVEFSNLHVTFSLDVMNPDGREFALRDPAKFDGCTEIAVSPGNCIRVEPAPEK